MTGEAVFSLFARRLPKGRGFLIAAGREDCLAFLESFSFTGSDLAYLRRTQDYGEATLERFRRLWFTGDVWAVPEGTAVFAGEPLLEVTAPIAEAQLAETVLLNHITSQTSVATKAARCVLAAGGAQLVDFAFRRTQGIGAGLAVARASAIAGFTATSNVEAARCYGLTAAGTIAHSFIEAFGDEYAAFAEDYPGKTTFLVDTYDTEQGVRTAIDVADRLRLMSRRPIWASGAGAERAHEGPVRLTHRGDAPGQGQRWTAGVSSRASSHAFRCNPVEGPCLTKHRSLTQSPTSPPRRSSTIFRRRVSSCWCGWPP
jgi:nicotinate phosphoribosyltransferase